MNISQHRFGDLPGEVMVRVNQTCNRFEQRWRRGENPRVEDMLNGADPAHLDTLVHELLPLEIEYRRRAKMEMSVEAYQSRFPEIDETWLAKLLVECPDETRPADAINRAISHYVLERQLGEGGMGKVFQARDAALGRECALKILADSLSPSLRKRWMREARTFARLQHPSIARFYESGDEDGESFIAMELVRGPTLRERLAQGRLAVEDAINIAESLLQALGHAHSLGILHRDIKPENIMLTESGRVKLLDFGLAKDIRQVADEARSLTQVTGAGGIIGTVGYMSPEQLRGETLDERSDIFSVGAVLYEMVAGKPAFPGATPTERVAAILSSDPEPVGGAEIPLELNAVLQKSLARNAMQRYPSAAAFMSDLRQVGSGELNIQLPDSLVVFDFVNLGGRVEDDWIGVGMAETLYTSLAQVPELQVVPREKLSRLQASSPTSDPQSLGLKLGCRWLVAGTFQKMGSALRLSVHLTELLTNETIMTGQVDGTCEEIFDLQDRVSALVRDKMGDAQPEQPAPPPQPRPQISAYEYFLKGRQAWLTSDKRELERAQELFERAVDVDPNYAPALAGMATASALRYTFTTDPAVLEIAEDYARRAIKADPRLSEAHVWLGYIQFHHGDVVAAFQEEQLAIQEDPTNFLAYYLAACFAYSDLGREHGLLRTADPHRPRREGVLRLLQQALENYESHGFTWLGASVAHLDLGNIQESLWCAEQAIALRATGQDDTVAAAEGFIGELMRRTGDYDAARRRCLSSIKAFDDSDHLYDDTYRAMTLCTLGKTALQQGDSVAARSAFKQAVLHTRGRNRARAIGHPFVHALCGLAQTDQDAESFREAYSTFRNRAGFNFAWFWHCCDDETLLALAQGAAAVGEVELARQLHAEAIECGSTEAPHVQIL